MRVLLGLLLFTVLFYSMNAHAQATHESTVRIKVINETKEPLTFATVLVMNVPDTIHKQQQLTDSNGVAILSLTPMRPYIFRITSINYQTFEKNITVKSENATYTFVAKKAEQKLSEVVVTA